MKESWVMESTPISIQRLKRFISCISFARYAKTVFLSDQYWTIRVPLVTILHGFWRIYWLLWLASPNTPLKTPNIYNSAYDFLLLFCTGHMSTVSFLFNILCVYVCVILSVTTAVNILCVLTMGGRLRWLWLSSSPPLLFLLCVIISRISLW